MTLRYKLWGRLGVRLRPEMVEALNKLPEDVRKLLWDSVVSGQSTAKVHGGTHAEGFAADFDFQHPGWNRKMARSVKFYLSAAFAVAFRVGESQYSTGNHLHIALRGKSNAAAILAANSAFPERNANAINEIWAE